MIPGLMITCDIYGHKSWLFLFNKLRFWQINYFISAVHIKQHNMILLQLSTEGGRHGEVALYDIY